MYLGDLVDPVDLFLRACQSDPVYPEILQALWDREYQVLHVPLSGPQDLADHAAQERLALQAFPEGG